MAFTLPQAPPTGPKPDEHVVETTVISPDRYRTAIGRAMLDEKDKFGVTPKRLADFIGIPERDLDPGYLADLGEITAAEVHENGMAGLDQLPEEIQPWAVNKAIEGPNYNAPVKTLQTVLNLNYKKRKDHYKRTGSSSLEDQLKRDEGYGKIGSPGHPYQEKNGTWVIGYGHNVLPGEEVRFLSKREATELLRADIVKAKELAADLPVYAGLDDTRKDVLVNMVFNMGLGGVKEFKKALKAMKEEKWGEARAEMLDSDWAGQVKDRAYRLADKMFFGAREEGKLKVDGHLGMKTLTAIADTPSYWELNNDVSQHDVAAIYEEHGRGEEPNEERDLKLARASRYGETEWL